MPVVNFMGHNFQAVASNWIAVSRDVRDHHLVGFGQPVKAANPKKGAFSRAEAWLDLIMLARWKDGPEMNKGRKVDMLAGQLQGGYSFLADRWNWTVQTVRTFVGKLIGERMIERSEEAPEFNKQNNNQIQVLTVCNYKRYQLMNELMDLQDQQASNKRATSEQQHLNKDTLIQEDISPIGDSSPAVQGDLLECASKPKGISATEAVKQAVDAWNAMAEEHGLSTVKKVSDDRRRKLIARIKEAGGLQAWVMVIHKIPRSKILMENDTWAPNIDFVCRPSSFLKLVEGAYDTKFRAGEANRHSRPRTQEEADRAYLDRLAEKYLDEAAA